MATCPYCDNPVPPGVNRCPSCGAAIQQQEAQSQFQAVPAKNVVLAGILSGLIIGAGQMYNGQVAKGIVLLLASIILGLCVSQLFSTAIWIIGIIDAVKIAKKFNNGQNITPWEFF